MHEVSLAEGVIDVVERAAEGAHATAVSEVRVAVGELSNVEIEALAFAFESVKKGTVANDAKLVIDRPEGRAWCMTCQKDVPYHRFGDACPICGGYQVVVSGGRDMRVVDIKATTSEDSDKTDS